MGFFKKHPALILGMGITLLILILAIGQMAFIEALEYKYYDLRMKLRSDRESPSEIVLVDIDNDAIDRLGRWPWPRSIVASGIEKIHVGEPNVIGLNLILSEAEESNGLREIEKLEELFASGILPNAGSSGEAFYREIRDAKIRLDNDAKLAEAMRSADRIILPVIFKQSVLEAENASGPEAALQGREIPFVRRMEGGEAPLASEIVLPISRFLDVCKGIGHINFAYDTDGVTRRERLLYEYRGIYIPSYTLRIAAYSLNIGLDQIRVELGSEVELGAKKIALTPFSELLIGFKGPSGAFRRYPFYDVFTDKIPASVFKDKIVLVSASASGIMNPISTPTDTTMPFGELTAQTIWSILNHNHIRLPSWSFLAQFFMILFVGVIIAVVLPRLKAKIAGVSFVTLICAMLGGSMYLFVSKGLWVPVMFPLLQLIIGYIGVVTIQYLVTETGKEKVEGESAETNRMLGVSFQEQGMLDMAFDKFRRVPVDSQMKGLLYNLGLDYERKRQFNKAAAVYEYIEEYDGKFKDIAERKKKLLQASETMVFGESFLGGSTGGDPLMSTGTDTRPTLGRYEIVKALGKGAMGVVYLGQDPRINRTCAIKTIRFSNDFAPEEAAKMKEQFFREAESAGTLSHPNIVTIYDAGEEKELAYIAMEFLEGEDLEKFTKKDNLLPVRKVIDLIADVADGLDYAHQKGVVHRDIKPANIMLLKSGIVKITDFGIARITASSQTQTGIVKGTPYYMSPEQISGKKVDGRSDIFSLGVMLYQLLTGAVPFTGDSPAALMHQILNVKHPDPRELNPKIVKPLAAIIDKSLEKDFEKRYQRASQLTAHLRELGKRIDAALIRKQNPGQ